MANVKLDPPEPFQFKYPDAWPKWKRKFEQFRSASGLSTQDEARQISMLLYCLGEDAEDVLVSTDITAEQRRSYATVMMVSSKSEGMSYLNVPNSIVAARKTAKQLRSLSQHSTA